MGLIHAEIELINGEDLGLARRHYIGEEEVRRFNVTALVDTGAIMLCINENIQEYMQFPFFEKRRTQTADGRIIDCDVVGQVEVRFRNRGTTCRAMVLPSDSEVLLGAIPLEDMDVIIDAQRQELTVNPNHHYMAQMTLKEVR